MKVLLLTRYGATGASSRVRTLQFLPYLEANGFSVQTEPLLSDDYLQQRYESASSIAVLPVAARYAARLRLLLARADFDLLWIEKELLPWMPWGVEKLLLRGRPYVVDYDDAVFHNYDEHPNPAVRALLGNKIDHVMRGARLVIAGNDYLARRAEQAGAPRVEQLPSVIDLDRYQQAAAHDGPFTVGWIGSPGSERLLLALHDVLREVTARPGYRLVLVGSKGSHLKNVQLESRPWHEDTEVAEIRRFDVGIMPLPDEPWTRGKCGYKLIQYMGCALPVIASPVGVNAKIVRHGVNGFLASNAQEWQEALCTLRDNPGRAREMGQAGYADVKGHYSLRVAAPRLADMLRSAAAT